MTSTIIAPVEISLSELQHVDSSITTRFAKENKKELYKILFDLGIDTSKPVIEQEGILHRNRFNKVQDCLRFVGYEREDTTWLKSGYASKAVRDKVSGNKLLEDMYRKRKETFDAKDE